ncbi:uncharacterized protein LOC143301600 [Babylonia areolata]|uniref:uncharacterized protein LOC143301600 n=1 Tax=Babylonia areolata TaxID=304850 RepID=UPI003FD2EE7B
MWQPGHNASPKQVGRVMTPRCVAMVTTSLAMVFLLMLYAKPAYRYGVAERAHFFPVQQQQQQQQQQHVDQLEDSDRPGTQTAHDTGRTERCESTSDLPLAMMERDVTWNEPWPEMEIGVTPPGQVAPAVHYVWCGGSRQLKFQHYLGLLSALRVLKPLKFYFYYTHNQPVQDRLWYNTWFQEFKEAVPVMDIVQMGVKHSCGSREMLKAILDILTAEGGVYLGERLILAGIPPDFLQHDNWYAFVPGDRDLTRGIVYVRKDFGAAKQNANDLLEKILADRTGCVSVQKLNDHGHGAGHGCVLMDQTPNYPRDIWGARTAFGELARWLFYGQRAAYQVQRDPSKPIPRIAHYIRVQSNERPMYQDKFSFTHFMSVLSALYVGGFHHVYMHVDKEPGGSWWDLLKKENVTVIRLQKPSWVYQQKITGITHFSDVSRYNILYRHGGAYQDFDCVWTSRVPDDLLEYPTVISPAISKNDPWPDGLALGMIMARPGAPFIRHAFKGYRTYRGNNYLYNAIMRSYRTYEQFPDTVHFDPHFKVFCVEDKCFPQWMRNSHWDLKKNGGRDYAWSTETRALHLVIPKVWKSFESPAALKKGKDMVADVGRNILQKAGRMSLLDNA